MTFIALRSLISSFIIAAAHCPYLFHTIHDIIIDYYFFHIRLLSLAISLFH